MEDDDNIYDKVTKHDEIIAANLGDDYALERVKDLFFTGGISKEAYAAALRGHQAAVNATKSEQREEAYKVFKEIDDFGLGWEEAYKVLVRETDNFGLGP